MSWFNTGYDAAKEEAKKGSDGNGPRRIWVKPKETIRVMFLDDDPISFWEHGFKMNGKWGHFEPCHKKNRALASLSGGRCPICNSGDKMWPYLVGLHTAMDMTPWFTAKENREVNLQRKIYGAKLGSDEKPGILKKLERLRSTHGRLKGLIFDIYRSGAKTESVGDEFTLFETIKPAEGQSLDAAIEAYGRAQLGKYVERHNAKLPAKDHLTMDVAWKRNPWTAFNFEKLMGENGPMAPRPLSELDRLFGAGGGAGDHGGGGGNDDASDGDESPY